MGVSTVTPVIRHRATRRDLWPQATCIILGGWLASSALTINPHPWELMLSDLVSSAVIVGGSALACSPRYKWLQWVVASVGLWLLCAPLVFWAPTAAAYGMDTLVGSIVVTLTVLVPGTVGIRDIPGPEVPPGWNYNPSAWIQRIGIITFAFLQFFIARYMAAFQMGHIDTIWDPVFGNGTRNVLESKVSKAFPISDAGLGAVTYLVEGLTGFLGGTRRWRTMPFAVVLFGVMIVPVGVVSIVLVILQPVAVGSWCFWCLVTAAFTLVMIAPAIDELVATLLFLGQARREGKSLWTTFWKGDTVKAPGRQSSDRQQQSWLRKLGGGLELLSIPWNLAVAAACGLWLMAAPVALGNTGTSANNNHLVGALITTFAVIGFGEAGRAVRWINIPLGGWMLIAPHLLSGSTDASWWNDMAVGAAVILLTFRRGRIQEHYGAWDKWIF